MFDLQGHRGARGLYPENTIEGFEAASRLGFRSFEVDIAVTRDGVPVLHHDPHLNPDTARTGDGAWLPARGPLLRDLTLTDLAIYDVGRIRPGSAYAATYPTQTPHDGARIPTLERALGLRPALRFNIELKLLPDHPEWTVCAEEMAERVLHVIDRAEAAHRVTVQSFDWRGPRHVRRVRPELACGWLTRAETIRAAPLWRGDSAAPTEITFVPDAVAAEGGGTWTSFHTELTRDLLDRAHALGLKVIPWTVNRAEDMRRLIGWGVDGLISDWPDRVRALLPP
jgi:glycerophosphoryl diester phosphodiesterase